MTYKAPTLLEPRHKIANFSCVSTEQTEWLRRHARQSVASGTTKVLVVTPTDSDQVVAYYAWNMAQIEAADAPARILKGAGRYPQPVALLARLGVDRQHEGQGLGAGLLQDVLQRVAAISEKIGCRGLLVHAELDHARRFYQHLIPEFEQSPTDPLHLVMLLKDIKRSM